MNIRPAIEDIAIIIIIIGETIPAETAASPKINPPRMDTADPLVVDILKSLSLSISKEIIINKASIYAGNGTKLLPALSMRSRGNGTKS